MNFDESLARLRRFIAGLHEKAGTKQEKVGSFKELLQAGTYFEREPYGALALAGVERTSYKNCLHDITEIATKKELISKAAVESHVQTAILKVVNADAHGAEEFNQRLSEAMAELKRSLLLTPARWELYLQVLGLSANGLPQQFGPCRFYLADQPVIALLHGRVTHGEPVAIAATDAAAAQPDATLEMLRKMMLGGIWSEVHVEAIDKEAALRLAERRLRLTIDVINFFAELTQDRTRIFLPGDAGPSARYALRIASDGSTPDLAQIRVGPLAEFSFTQIPQAMTRMLGLQKVSDWLAEPRPSDLQDRILSALQWAGRAGVEERREEAFLLYAIALEGLLLGGKSHVELTERLAVRGAHLLSGDPKARENVYDELKALYGIRSKIVHSGSVEVTDDELDRIAAVVRGALVTILHMSPLSGMTAESQLEDWFKEQLLGGTQVPYEKSK
ncbi:MAG: hypothetical protein WBE13_16300 [Candidatus Acidiferrum sp.]